MGRDSSNGIATRYGLDGPGIESRWGARPSISVQTGPAGTHPASYTMGAGSFRGVKRPGRGVDHPSPSSAEVEGRVELYICSPSGPSWPVLGRALPLLFMYIYIHTHTTAVSDLKHTPGRYRILSIIIDRYVLFSVTVDSIFCKSYILTKVHDWRKMNLTNIRNI